MKERKPTAPFPSNLKNFARTLHFHSPAAYEFVRRNFLNYLPCTQILNSWICSKEYKFGISEEINNNISTIVKQESAKSKKLIFNLVFDEMNPHSWNGLVDLDDQLHETSNREHKIENIKLLVKH